MRSNTPISLTSSLIGAFALAGSLGLAGCSKGSDKKPAPSTSAQPGEEAQSEAELDAVLATIDGIEITVREFQNRINSQSPYIRARYTSNEQKKEFLDNLVRFEVLALEAKAQGFDKNPEVVRTMKQVMIQKLMKEQFDTGIKPEDVSDEEMRAHYQESESEFHKPEEVRVSAIIIDKEADAKAIAKEALGEKGASNKGFRELVALHSTDQETKARGGDLRYFTAEATELPKALVEAAFKLEKTGDVAGPIAANNRFYIIKQTGHRKAIDKTFEQVKRQIQNRLYRDKRTQAQKDFVADLKKKATIEIFEDKLNEVQIDTSAAAEGGAGHEGPQQGHGHEHNDSHSH
mgnify:CR=1 FL=1